MTRTGGWDPVVQKSFQKFAASRPSAVSVVASVLMSKGNYCHCNVKYRCYSVINDCARSLLPANRTIISSEKAALNRSKLQNVSASVGQVVVLNHFCLRVRPSLPQGQAVANHDKVPLQLFQDTASLKHCLIVHA